MSIQKKDINIIPNDKLISWREIGGEVVFFHKEEMELYELNKTANFIWKKAVEKKNIGKIIEEVQARYKEINEDIVQKDTLNFIDRLLKKRFFLIKR